MSTWVVVLIVVVVVAVVAAVVAAVLHNRRQKEASSAMGLPPIGALSGEEPVVDPGGTVADEPVDQPRRR